MPGENCRWASPAEQRRNRRAVGKLLAEQVRAIRADLRLQREIAAGRRRVSTCPTEFLICGLADFGAQGAYRETRLPNSSPHHA